MTKWVRRRLGLRRRTQVKDGFARVASCGGIRMVNATLGIAAVMILVGAYRRVMGHVSIHLRQFKPGLFAAA